MAEGPPEFWQHGKNNHGRSGFHFNCTQALDYYGENSWVNSIETYPCFGRIEDGKLFSMYIECEYLRSRGEALSARGVFINNLYSSRLGECSNAQKQLHQRFIDRYTKTNVPSSGSLEAQVDCVIGSFSELGVSIDAEVTTLRVNVVSLAASVEGMTSTEEIQSVYSAFRKEKCPGICALLLEKFGEIDQLSGAKRKFYSSTYCADDVAEILQNEEQILDFQNLPSDGGIYLTCKFPRSDSRVIVERTQLAEKFPQHNDAITRAVTTSKKRTHYVGGAAITRSRAVEFEPSGGQCLEFSKQIMNVFQSIDSDCVSFSVFEFLVKKHPSFPKSILNAAIDACKSRAKGAKFYDVNVVNPVFCKLGIEVTSKKSKMPFDCKDSKQILVGLRYHGEGKFIVGNCWHFVGVDCDEKLIYDCGRAEALKLTMSNFTLIGLMKEGELRVTKFYRVCVHTSLKKHQDIAADPIAYMKLHEGLINIDAH